MKKQKYKHYEIIDPVYRADLDLYIGDTKEIKKELEKKYKKNYLKEIETSAGLFVDDCNNYAIVLSKFDIPNLIHELVHYCFRIFKNRGVVISLKNDEAMAYYLEMTYDNIIKAIKDGK